MTTLSSDSIAKLAPSWVKAQAELKHVKKSVRGQVGKNNNYRYADFAGTVDAIKPILANHGLAFTQGFMPCTSGVIVRTTLVHESGEWMSDGGLQVPASQQNAQQYGSAATYARRYGLTAFCGLATEDDDGRSASSVAVGAPASVPANVESNGLTDAERGALRELAINTGKFTPVQAQRRVANLKKGEIAKFRADCKQAIAEAAS